MGNTEKSELSETLLIKMQVDPRSALEEIMNIYGSDIKKLIYAYLKNLPDTEDVIQEVFMTVYLKLGSFQGNSSLKSWLYTIAINKCKDHIRSQYYQPRRLIERIQHRTITQKNRSEGPEEYMMKSTETGILFKNIMTLPIKYREVVALYYFKDLSIKEISSILKVKETTIQTRLARARGKIKDLLVKAKGD